MTITVKHSKVSSVADGTDTSVVRPSDWNADHSLVGTVPIANGGTGQATANDAFNALAPSQTAASGKYLTTDGTNASWATNPLGTVTSVAATAGTGISVSGSPITTSGTLNITNTAPDQTVVLTAGTGISTTGTYPNFTITNTSPSSGGTVTSVAATVPSVFSIAGSPITTSGTLAITYSGTALPVVNGGTGVTTSTGTTNVVLSGSPTIVTPVIAQINDANGNAELKFSAIASAVNQVTIENAATGNPVHISATGTDASIGIHLAPKGASGYINVQGGVDSTKRFMFNPDGGTTSTRTMLSTSQTVDRTLTLPDATDTLVGKATTDTLTNKSISGTTNTFTNIPNSGLTNSAITINGTSTSLGGSITVGSVTSVTGTSPVVSSGGATPAISMPAATTSVNGYLTSTDWNTFNGKGSGTVTSVAALTLGTTGTDLSSTVATGTTTPVITLQVPTASASNRGALSAADWTTFNNKGSGTVTSVTGTAPVVSSGGATPAISMAAATTSVNGYLTSTDWNTFNGKAPAVTYTTTYVPFGQGTTTPNLSSSFTYTTGTGSLSAPTVTSSNGIFSTPNGSLGAGNATRFKNRIINGDMRVDQRNAGASVTITATAYTLDRWSAYCGGVSSKFSVQQNSGSVTPPVGFINYLGAVSASAYSVSSTDRFGLSQTIEGLNASDLAWGTASAKTITLSFWVYSSLTGTFGGAVTNYAGARSYPFSYSIPTANTWTQISVTIAGDTSGTWLTTNSGFGTVYFSIGAGSTYSGTAGAWAAADYRSATGAVSVVGTNGATFYITGVQFEIGSAASSFEVVDYTTQLAMCQRYFEKNSDVIDGTNGPVGFYSRTNWFYKVTKRTTPTITAASGSSGTVGTITNDFVVIYIAGTASAYFNTGSTVSAEL